MNNFSSKKKICFHCRWNNSKHKSNSSDGLKMHRKNSNPLQNFTSLNKTIPTQHVQPMLYHATVNNNNYNKSSSYPNFAPTANSTILTNAAALTDIVQRSLQAIGQNQATTPQIINSNQPNVAVSQESLTSLVYRHSLNNLISLQQIQNSNNMVAPSSMGSGVGGGQKLSTTSSTIMGLPLGESIASVAGNCENLRNKNDIGRLTVTNGLNSSIGDINSRLECLCLQMTEQAIN